MHKNYFRYFSVLQFGNCKNVTTISSTHVFRILKGVAFGNVLFSMDEVIAAEAEWQPRASICRTICTERTFNISTRVLRQQVVKSSLFQASLRFCFNQPSGNRTLWWHFDLYFLQVLLNSPAHWEMSLIQNHQTSYKSWNGCDCDMQHFFPS